MAALSMVVWFKRAYAYLGLDGCSSHSGRRTLDDAFENGVLRDRARHRVPMHMRDGHYWVFGGANRKRRLMVRAPRRSCAITMMVPTSPGPRNGRKRPSVLRRPP